MRWGCHHSSVDSSALSSDRYHPGPRVRVPSTPSTLLSFIVTFSKSLHCEKNENKQKRGRVRPIFINKECVWVKVVQKIWCERDSKRKSFGYVLTSFNYCYNECNIPIIMLTYTIQNTGQLLWHSRQSTWFQHPRVRVRIQSSAVPIYETFIYCYLHREAN